MAIAIGVLLNLVFCLSSFADEDYALEKIVVRGASSSKQSQNYPSETISAKDIQTKKINSTPDILKYVSGVDLRYRSTSGVQGDLSIRGSTYEQVDVLIDGIRINDSQTGHHNLDIPLTSMDIEKIEVIKQGMGSINITTKKPLKKSTSLETIAGAHALYGQAFSCDMPGKTFPTVSHSNTRHLTARGPILILTTRPFLTYLTGTGQIIR